MEADTVEYIVGNCPVRDVNPWYVCRHDDSGVKYLARDGRWSDKMNTTGIGGGGAYFSTKEEAGEMMAKWTTPRPPAPAWHDRPTGPGLWLAEVDTEHCVEYHGQVIAEGDDITAPVIPGLLRVFGPIAM